MCRLNIRKNDIIAFDIIAILPEYVAILLETKAWYLQNQINGKSKHLNRTVNPQAFVTSIDVLPSKNQALYEYYTLVSKLKHC